MATNVDIANLALAHLGDDATISDLEESSAQANHCKRFLPIARDTLLEMHPWKFAVRRIAPALLTGTNSAWLYSYAEPADCIRILGVLPNGYINDAANAVQYECESLEDGSGVILSNYETITLRYIARVVNPARFSPLFTETLAWLLAAYVAGPLIKGQEGQAAAGACWSSFLNMYGRAAGSNANQGKLRLEQLPAWLGARGDGGVETNAGGWAELGPVRG